MTTYLANENVPGNAIAAARQAGIDLAWIRDPLSLTPEMRPDYEYEGPEVIYTFWAKHGPCQASECNHRTPIMSSPVIAVKQLTVKAWTGKECQSCGGKFDIEQKDARMAPAAMLVVADTETPFAVMEDDGHYACPHCGHQRQDQKAASDGQSSSLGKAKNKKIDLTLLIHPDWLKGSPGEDANGNLFGGSVTDSAEATAAWDEQRNSLLKLIEVRGKLPAEIICPDTQERLLTGDKGGTVPRQAHFTCQKCGMEQKVMESVSATGKHAPVSEYALQGYCPECDNLGVPYNGRFFTTPNWRSYHSATTLWLSSKSHSLKNAWPEDAIPFGNRTHIKDPLPKHGYTHWWHLFNLRQLLVHSLIVTAIKSHIHKHPEASIFVAGAFQQYLRNQNMFCIWNIQRDTPEPFFSNNNFNPKNRVAENNVFSKLGRGNWESCASSLFDVLDWRRDPWEILPLSLLATVEPHLAKGISGKSTKAFPCDPPVSAEVACCSSTDLSHITDGSLDLAITDPPFGDLIQYAELSDFFYVWLRLFFEENSGSPFSSDQSPKALEAVTNETRHPDDADGFYKKVLTQCWRTVARKLKEAGILAFTFHHSEDEPWIAVLESLFEAGFILEATFPIDHRRVEYHAADHRKFGIGIGGKCSLSMGDHIPNSVRRRLRLRDP